MGFSCEGRCLGARMRESIPFFVATIAGAAAGAFLGSAAFWGMALLFG